MGAALRRETWPTRLAELGLTGAMFLGSLAMICLPLAWLWFLSNLSLSYLGVYFLALIGCPTAIVGSSWGLILLSRAYTNLSGRDGRPVLEASITLAVLLAIGALIVWMVFLDASGDTSQGLWPG
jgi:uncharacterized membrane-anchored protein YitT (DUF2179 family)